MQMLPRMLSTCLYSIQIRIIFTIGLILQIGRKKKGDYIGFNHVNPIFFFDLMVKINSYDDPDCRTGRPMA